MNKKKLFKTISAAALFILLLIRVLKPYADPSVDELQSMIQGTWVFEETKYIFSGSKEYNYCFSMPVGADICYNPLPSNIKGYGLIGVSKTYQFSYSLLLHKPILNLTGNSYAIVKLTDEEMILQSTDSSVPSKITLKKEEANPYSLDGTYRYKNKIIVIKENKIFDCGSASDFGNIQALLEKAESYPLQYIDDERILIEGQVLSEIPLYRWRQEENGNLLLLSDGINTLVHLCAYEENMLLTDVFLHLEKIDDTDIFNNLP